MARVNILRRVKTSKGWGNVALKRNQKGRVQWPSGGRFLIEWRENGKRLRASARETPAEATLSITIRRSVGAPPIP